MLKPQTRKPYSIFETNHMTTITPPFWVRKLYKLMEWMDNWKPLSFNWCLLLDDGCGCELCEKRRIKGEQGPRKYGK